MSDTTIEETLREIGLTLLCMEMRTRLRAGIHPDAVTRWVDDAMMAASKRVDAIEGGVEFKSLFSVPPAP